MKRNVMGTPHDDGEEPPAQAKKIEIPVNGKTVLAFVMIALLLGTFGTLVLLRLFPNGMLIGWLQ